MKQCFFCKKSIDLKTDGEVYFSRSKGPRKFICKDCAKLNTNYSNLRLYPGLRKKKMGQNAKLRW